MAVPITAAPARQLSTSPVRTFAAMTILGIAVIVAVTAFAVWGSRTADDSTVVPAQYGEGYPAHGGLAGPSRISVFNQFPSMADGYPLHGGLAGPSRVLTVDQPGYGAGYPLHGGLAGPSRVLTVDQPGYGAGYPLHGGLAGPSQVGEGE